VVKHSSDEQRPVVGFVGLGVMGEPMALCLARARFELLVRDLSDEPVQRVVAAGGKAASSVAEVGAACDVMLVAVVDDAQVEAVVRGGTEPGLLSTCRPGSVIVVHSTVHPDTTRRLAARCAEKGVGFLDAPVTGGPAAAAGGALTVIVGGAGAGADLERSRPALECVGGRICHVGGVGTGQTVKIANNMVLATTLQAVYEALALTGSAGLDTDEVLEVLCSGSAESWAARHWRTIGASARSYPMGVPGVARLTGKDLALALSIADERRLDLPVTELTSGRLEIPYRAAAGLS
jgi:3-hydroxyisobutyrate dehydrogenase-like beta-hydroxyacid dehydrogenase